ncbi:PREDICTED: 15-hydroxyprostaglandin dehydrogenase [NAD(+)]-like [Papilio polytes]|uniref:15-hydroxyprostaglandin dehydrogenase [NAD(+)]-like n=1 Tax=Papilio polytes TaxID=76194 RepID=UPI0006765AB7|nr:PREDICTED: 15-hydroxyprostaglandin dehydrogenase [NAD(+)]-like [Papilio polytes]
MAAQWDAKNKNCLITGAAAGLGAAYVEALLKEGAKKVAVVDIDEQAGQELVAQLNETYNNSVIFVKCDVSKEPEIDHCFNIVVKEFGNIDVLINNAGIMSDLETTWRLASDVNYQGLVSFTMKAVKHMRKDEGGAGGVIVNIASTAGLTRINTFPIYSGCKAAVIHFSQNLALPPFFDDTGIRVMVLCPGATATKLVQGLAKKVVDMKNSQMMEEMFGKVHIQSVESAVITMLKLLKDGNNGSIWLSTHDRPPHELTPQINKYFDELEKLTFLN